jgi:hypothetical protein
MKTEKASREYAAATATWFHFGSNLPKFNGSETRSALSPAFEITRA